MIGKAGTVFVAPVYLFAYGTLRRGAAADLSVQYPDAVRWHSAGWLKGHLFRVTYYPGLVLYPADQRVVGDIFELMQPNHMLQVLDAFEACSPQSPPPHEYVRRLLTINRADAPSLQAWVYVYNHGTQTLDSISSGDFLNS